MNIEWHQVEEFFASEQDHFVRVQPMVMGPGYSATMNHLNDEGRMEIIIIPTKNEEGNWTTGTPFMSIDEAKEAAEKFLVDHLAIPPEQRETRLMQIMERRI